MLENQTGEFYFKQMKCSQRIKFVRNFISYTKNKNSKYNFMKEKYFDFYSFLSSAFIFSSTKEGYNYWFTIINKIYYQK